MSAVRPRLQSRHWFGKASAGVVLGYALSVALSGVIALATPGGFAGEGKVQFTMWMIAPVWANVLGFVFLFRDGVRAWAWLGAATAAAFGLLWAMKSWMG